MALIKIAETGFYRIPLTVALSDSTHGEIKAFELLTCRVHDSDGAEGVGYTYTVGRNGGAIADVLRREIPELIEGREADDTKGFRAIKMKVGRPDLGSDVTRVQAMRKHLGNGFPLMADANMKWTVEEAIRAARALQPYDLTWLEEPIIPDDIAGHARIMAAGGVPIAAGENLRSLWEFKNYISAGAVSYPEPDVTNCGGVTAFMKIARLAEAFNLPVTSHGAHDVTVHLLAACPNRSYLEAHGFGLDRYIEHPLALDQGMASAPRRPGHGITFDWKGLAQLAR
jgi:L-alanine-DL-glutamate epimerase-like enolase superfamily enzyme